MRKTLNTLVAAAITATMLLGVSGTASAYIAPAAAGVCPNAETPVSALTQDDAEAAVLCLTNLERENNGLADLTYNAQLASAARAHSADMVARQFFNHTNPDGVTACQRIMAAGYPGTCSPNGLCWTGRCGENIAWASYESTSPSVFMYGAYDGDPYAWMNSSGHRAAILNPAFTELGVGVATGYPWGAVGGTATQDFGSTA